MNNMTARILTSPVWKWLLVVLFVIEVSASMFQAWLPYEDDAYIFLRYADNIAHGYGFVWNRGDAPVEGYTSFLYLMLLTGLRMVGFTSERVLGWSGIILSALTLVVTIKVAEIILRSRISVPDLVVLILCGFSPNFVYWAMRGMDVPLFTFLLLVSTWVYLKYMYGNVPAWGVGLCFALLALARPEGILIFLPTLICDSVRLFIVARERWVRNVLTMVVSFSIAYVPYFLWRWNYFGYLFPNTYYAKTGGGIIQIREGLIYVVASLKAAFGAYFWWVLVLMGILTLLFYFLRGERWPAGWEKAYLITVAICILGMAALNGGDHFAYGRFIVPSLPYLALIVVSTFMELLRRHRWLAIALGIVGLTLIGLHYSQSDEYVETKYAWRSVLHQRMDWLLVNPSDYEVYPNWVQGFVMMGKTLRRVASPDESIAVVPVGAIGYYSGMRVIDMVGVVDPVIAHQPFDPYYIETWRPGHDKGDGRYILSLHPDYIQLMDLLTSQPVAEPDQYMLQYKSVVEIWNNPEFHAEYEFYPLKIDGGWYYNLYRRKH
jgi:hypothetical protein